jgi:hypothetical protein
LRLRCHSECHSTSTFCEEGSTYRAASSATVPRVNLISVLVWSRRRTLR